MKIFETIAWKRPSPLEEFYPALNKWFEIQAYRSKKGITVYIQENARLHREAQAEIAERKQAEEQQRVLQERILALLLKIYSFPREKLLACWCFSDIIPTHCHHQVEIPQEIDFVINLS